MQYVTSNDGVETSAPGFGVFQVPDPAVRERSVLDAIEMQMLGPFGGPGGTLPSRARAYR